MHQIPLEAYLSEFDRPSWDDVWSEMALSIGARSKCCRAQVGCVIVSADQEVIGAGYNGPPSEYPAEGSCSNWCPRGRGEGGVGNVYDNCPSSHAEANCIVRCDYSRLEGSTAYVSRSSCITCAKLLASAGVSRVIHRVSEDDLHRDPEAVEEFLRSCGVAVERWRD